MGLTKCSQIEEKERDSLEPKYVCEKCIENT